MVTTITGVVAPVLTPLDDSGRLRTQPIGDSVESTIECGCHAAITSGTGVQETAALTLGADGGPSRRPYSSVPDTGRYAINKWMNRTDIPANKRVTI